MNSWANLLQLTGWIIYAVLIIVIGLVIYGVILYVVGRIQVVRKRKRAFKGREELKQEEYLAEATNMGIRLYGDSPNASLEAFRAGARWGWLFFNRK